MFWLGLVIGSIAGATIVLYFWATCWLSEAPRSAATVEYEQTYRDQDNPHLQWMFEDDEDPTPDVEGEPPYTLAERQVDPR